MQQTSKQGFHDSNEIQCKAEFLGNSYLGEDEKQINNNNNNLIKKDLDDFK